MAAVCRKPFDAVRRQRRQRHTEKPNRCRCIMAGNRLPHRDRSYRLGALHIHRGGVRRLENGSPSSGDLPPAEFFVKGLGRKRSRLPPRRRNGFPSSEMRNHRHPAMGTDATRRQKQFESVCRHLTDLPDSAELPFQTDIELKSKPVTGMSFNQPGSQLNRRKRRQCRYLFQRFLVGISGKKTDPV